MLDRLRTKVGVSTFNAIWKGWPQKHRFASVDRSTYIDWASARAGQDLGPFLTAYLTSATTPRRLTTPFVDSDTPVRRRVGCGRVHKVRPAADAVRTVDRRDRAVGGGT